MAISNKPDVNPFQEISTSESLTQILIGHIHKSILDGTLKAGVQLPTEPELAKLFNVSRSTLRSALGVLEREGFIVRKRGVGTFVADEPLRVNNLNLNWGVTQVIRSTGAIPGTAKLSVTEESADSDQAERLHIEPETPIVIIKRVRTADGCPVVFSLDAVPKYLIDESEKDISLDDIHRFLVENESFYMFVREYLSLQIHHGIADLTPIIANEEVAEQLDIPPKSGVLLIQQVDYTEDERPLSLADEYHVTNAFTFSVYRRNF